MHSPSVHPFGIRPRSRRARPLAALTALLAAPLWLAGIALAFGQQSKPPAPPPTPVVVAHVKEVTESPTANYSGFLEPIDQARVSAIEAGHAKSIEKRTGERVKRGDVLAVLASPQLQLDLEVTEAQIKESEATLAEAQLKLNRLKVLFEKQLTPAEQFENEKASVAVIAARLDTARAGRDRLRERLKLLVVRAPVDGQVISYDLTLGEWVTQNKELYRIMNSEQIQVLIGVPARYVNSVPEGAAVVLAVPELGAKLNGRVLAVVRHVDSQSGNFLIRVVVDNPKGLVLSGLLAQVTVPTGAPGVVKVVPRDAIVRRGEATNVVVIRENTAQVVPVKVAGGMGDGVIVVAADLKAKEAVVVRGNERLFPGTPVTVTSTQ